jgi:transposase InsO family protein
MNLGRRTRVSAEEKSAVLALVVRTRSRVGWTVHRVLKRLGLPRGRYYEWAKRAGEDRLADRSTAAASVGMILEEEKQAVVRYALAHPKDGYRRLAWQMVDTDVAYVSPSSVYRILNDADLLYRWKRSRSVGEPPPKPQRPHERWHTDIMYLRVEGTWYFLVTVLDGYSRYVVHWELLTSMRAADVRRVIQQALERTGVKPQVVSDNGTQFTASEFKDLVKRFELEHIRIRTYHPESNGTLERFHRTTREALAEEELGNLSKARELIGRWVAHYNEVRLHAGLGYLPPAEYYRGDPERRLAERQVKLEQARCDRQRRNGERLRIAA